jgi:putative RecB family exonuclease
MITATEPRIRDYLSYSAVRTFQNCPLKYRFRYVDGLAEDCVSSSLIFGSAIHSAVEFYFRQQLSGESAPSLDLLLDVYQESWKERSEDNIEFGKSETADSLHEMSARMLQKFLNSDLIQPEGRIIGIEEEFRGVLIPGLPDLLGYVDLLLETDDAVIVRDFKTSRSAWDQQQAVDQSDQLLLYADLVRKVIPGKQLRLQFAVLTKSRDPKVQLLETQFDEGKLDRTKRIFQTVWSAIQSGHFYPSPSPMQCPSCGYRTQCEAWRGNTFSEERS